MSRSFVVADRMLVLVHSLALVGAAIAGCSPDEGPVCTPVDDDNPCTEDYCGADGLPANEAVAAGTACDVGGGSVCDGEGACVECLDTSDCSDGLVCSASSTCVPATCTDGIVNGEETDEDCGGSECPACGTGSRCVLPSDCESGVCEDMVCVAAACGDSVVNAAEVCDDGNTVDGDGCSAACADELCGDGVVNDGGTEACDDGNTTDGDGCTAACIVEICGDGVVNDGGAEACDDANDVDGDGCTACVIDVCGDGTVNDGGAEACDDGNTIDGDGCSAACVVEVCGDGTVNDAGAEQCDDGNTIDGDGCTAACVTEVCGDGVVNNAGTEQCDDGNTIPGDGCTASCVVEYCGDGVVNNGDTEECDTGGATGGCSDACELDADNDGLIDAWDPFPTDPTLPGRATPNLVYAHTSSRLYTVSPVDYAVTEIGAFTFDQSSGQVTDIAISRRGVVFAVTFNDLFVCNPASARCYYLADLPSTFNGLTMVPPGTLHPTEDTLVGIANSGNWYSIAISGTTAVLTQIGAYGGGQTNAGDVVSIQDVGTYGAVNRGGVSGNVIVECDPLTGAVLSDVVVTTGYTTIYGIAATADRVFAFNSGGQILEIDPAMGTFTVAATTGLLWWGAGAVTVITP